MDGRLSDFAYKIYVEYVQRRWNDKSFYRFCKFFDKKMYRKAEFSYSSALFGIV